MVYICADQRAGMDIESRKRTECKNRIFGILMTGNKRKALAGRNFEKLVDRTMTDISFIAVRIPFTMGI